MAAFDRRLKVSKVDSFTIDASSWAGDETITTLTVSNTDGLVTVGAYLINGTSLSVLLTGVTTGAAEVHFEYATATRSDCYKAIVIVIDDC